VQVEAFITLAVVAGVSAAVVWRTMNPPRERRRHRPRRRRTRTRPNNPHPAPVTPAAATPPVESSIPEPRADAFALLPSDPAEPANDPPRAVSLVMLALTIAFFAVLAVGILAAVGYLVKTQLDQYFTGL
jgi:nitrate reductase NapE component